MRFRLLRCLAQALAKNGVRFLCGLVPGLRMASGNLHESLKDSSAGSGQSRKHERTRSILVISEVALACMLLVGAGLMIRTFWNVSNANPGFDASRVLTMTVGVGETDYATPAQEAAFFENVLQRVRTVTGVQEAGTIDSLPMTGGFAAYWPSAPRPPALTGPPFSVFPSLISLTASCTAWSFWSP